jgi:hypothetical protein
MIAFEEFLDHNPQYCKPKIFRCDRCEKSVRPDERLIEEYIQCMERESFMAIMFDVAAGDGEGGVLESIYWCNNAGPTRSYQSTYIRAGESAQPPMMSDDRSTVASRAYLLHVPLMDVCDAYIQVGRRLTLRARVPSGSLTALVADEPRPL